MNELIYTGPTGVTATLTTESTQSHYGIPVLRLAGEKLEEADYGPADILPSGLTAAELVNKVASEMDAETCEAAQKFCAQWPEGPQMIRDMKTKLTGWEAIEAKENNDAVRLCKYADPTEDARENVSAEEARQIAKEDPSLIYARDTHENGTPSVFNQRP